MCGCIDLGYYMIGYLDINNYATTLVKAFVPSLSSMTLPQQLWEIIEEREKRKHRNGMEARP
jgi:hypothetical protein